MLHPSFCANRRKYTVTFAITFFIQMSAAKGIRHLHAGKINYYEHGWADAQRDDRPAKYRWRRLRKFRNFIPCRPTTPQSLADDRCWSAVQ